LEVIKIKTIFKSKIAFKNKMSNFPLFDSLNKDIPKKDLTIKEKEEFVSKIQDIDTSGKDLIYALIQIYHMGNVKEKLSDELPYKGKRYSLCKGKEDLTWSFTDFPIPLRHILYKFIKIHTQSMEEEEERQKKII